ncbi:MAG: hypothetical protein ABEH77_08350 [Halobacteriaceae archaeon]
MPTRRRLLAGAGVAAAAGLAGCLAPSPPDYCDPEAPPPTGFRIENRDDTAHAVDIEVVRDLLVHVETVFAERYEVAAGARREVSGVVPTVGRHILTARLADGTTERLYWPVTPGGCHPVVVAVTAEGLALSQPAGVETGLPGDGGGGGGG